MTTTHSIAPVFGISRHRLTTDGKGVTTLVAFQDCTLSCRFCLNPACLDSRLSIPLYSPNLLFDKVKRDDIYFRATGGGITFGGGEPCLRADFIKEFCQLCPTEWNIRIETALSVPEPLIEQLIPVIDEWIVDIKSLDPVTFTRYTGHDDSLRNSNLAKLIASVSTDRILVRLPLIPYYTTSFDIERDRKALAAMGFTRFETVPYVKEIPTKFPSMIPGMENGKAKCEVMKQIRTIIAQANDIDLIAHPCNHKGDCKGTCPLCEDELAELTALAPQPQKQLIDDIDKLIRELSATQPSDNPYEDKLHHFLAELPSLDSPNHPIALAGLISPTDISIPDDDLPL